MSFAPTMAPLKHQIKQRARTIRSLGKFRYNVTIGIVQSENHG
jgi:hypothetical protein